MLIPPYHIVKDPRAAEGSVHPVQVVLLVGGRGRSLEVDVDNPTAALLRGGGMALDESRTSVGFSVLRPWRRRGQIPGYKEQAQYRFFMKILIETKNTNGDNKLKPDLDFFQIKNQVGWKGRRLKIIEDEDPFKLMM